MAPSWIPAYAGMTGKRGVTREKRPTQERPTQGRPAQESPTQGRPAQESPTREEMGAKGRGAAGLG